MPATRTSSSPSSASVVLVAGISLYLLGQGSLIRSTWLCLNVLDTFKSLRTVRGNGRSVGMLTRKRAIRECLKSWVVFVAIENAQVVPERLFSWFPLYSALKVLVTIGFLSTRASSSSSIYASTIRPVLRRYETPIDLTILLLSSIIALVSYYVCWLPLETLATCCTVARSRIGKFIPRATFWFSSGLEPREEHRASTFETPSIEVTRHGETTGDIDEAVEETPQGGPPRDQERIPTEAAESSDHHLQKKSESSRLEVSSAQPIPTDTTIGKPTAQRSIATKLRPPLDANITVRRPRPVVLKNPINSLDSENRLAGIRSADLAGVKPVRVGETSRARLPVTSHRQPRTAVEPKSSRVTSCTAPALHARSGVKLVQDSQAKALLAAAGPNRPIAQSKPDSKFVQRPIKVDSPRRSARPSAPLRSNRDAPTINGVRKAMPALMAQDRAAAEKDVMLPSSADSVLGGVKRKALASKVTPSDPLDPQSKRRVVVWEDR